MRFIVLLLVLALASCQRHEMVISKILVDRLEGAELLPVGRSELYDWALESVRGQKKFVFSEGDEKGAVLHVALGASQKQVSISTECNQLQASTTFSYASKTNLKSAFQSALANNLQSLLASFGGEKMGSGGAAQKIQEYVAGKSVAEEELIVALRTVAEDQDAALAPLVAKVLKGPKLKPSIMALSVLGQVASPETIDAVTEFAERRPAEVRRHAIEAARKIGGKKAAAWLFTMSTGHDDAQVRTQARLALMDVERRMSKDPITKIAADSLPPTNEARL